MADTTLTNVLLLAPELSTTLTTDRFTLFLSDAKQEIAQYNLDVTVEERTQRYLIAHYATINNTGIIKKAINGLELGYSSYKAGEDLESTIYGREAKRLLVLYHVDTSTKGVQVFELFSQVIK